MKILVLNSGSSSQKSSLYQIDETLPDDPPTPLWEGKIEWHKKGAETEVKNARGIVQKNRATVSSRFSIPDFIADCRQLRRCIRGRINGSKTVFAATDFTGSIISIARSVPQSF